MSKTTALVTATLAISLLLQDGGEYKKQIQAEIDRLDSADTDVRAKASQALKDRRDYTIEKTLQLLEKESKKSGTDRDVPKMTNLATVLGEYRAVEAVPLLLKLIRLSGPSRPVSASKHPPLKDRRPVVVALISIGLPAANKIIEETAKAIPHNKEDLLYMALVLNKVHGRETANAIIDKKAEILSEASQDKAAKIKANLEKLKDFTKLAQSLE